MQSYLFPALGRPNLAVLTEAYVTRVLTSQKEGGLVATGVEFTRGDKTYTVKAKKEVLLSAGYVGIISNVRQRAYGMFWVASVDCPVL